MPIKSKRVEHTQYLLYMYALVCPQPWKDNSYLHPCEPWSICCGSAITSPSVQPSRHRLNSFPACDVNALWCTFNVMSLYYWHPGMDHQPRLICLISSWENSIDFLFSPHLVARWKHISLVWDSDLICLSKKKKKKKDALLQVRVGVCVCMCVYVLVQFRTYIDISQA